MQPALVGVGWSGLQGYSPQIAGSYRIYFTQYLRLARHHLLGEACDDGFCRASKKWDLAGPGLLDSQDLVSTFDAQWAGGLISTIAGQCRDQFARTGSITTVRQTEPHANSGALTSRRLTVVINGAARQSAPVRRDDRSVQKAGRIADDCANGLLHKFQTNRLLRHAPIRRP